MFLCKPFHTSISRYIAVADSLCQVMVFFQPLEERVLVISIVQTVLGQNADNSPSGAVTSPFLKLEKILG